MQIDDFATPVVLYDMGLPLEERKDRALYFPTITDAANQLGYLSCNFIKRIGVGRYAHHDASGKKFAVRRMSSVSKDQLLKTRLSISEALAAKVLL